VWAYTSRGSLQLGAAHFQVAQSALHPCRDHLKLTSSSSSADHCCGCEAARGSRVSNAHFFAQLFVWAPSSHAQPCILSKPATCMLIPPALLRVSPTHLRFLVYQARNSVAITRVHDIARVRETNRREGGSEKERKRQQLEGLCTSHQMYACAHLGCRACVCLILSSAQPSP